MSTTLLVHIAGGALSIIAGFVALFATKGRDAHRRSGLVFVSAMLFMALTGAFIAVSGGSPGSMVAGLLATYLVITGFLALRATPAWFLAVMMSVSFMIAAFSLSMIASPPGDGIPPAVLTLFASVALIGGISDARLLRHGPPVGKARLRRHLWRMCFSLYLASASFFLGQADELPASLRIFPLLAIPAFLPLIAMGWWLWRTRARKAVRSPALSVAGGAP